MGTILATYEEGVFRPNTPVDLPERCKVEFEPRIVSPAAEDAPALDGIYGVLSERYQSGEHDVAARHDEHQPPPR
jgi:predicted DNA-binding antitoxin AbrB/MazE fold protein